MRTLASRMKARSFTEESSDGCFVDRARETYLEGRYVEKVVYEETLVDPFGREQQFERTSYSQVDFSLFSEFPHIEIRNAPRSTQSYMSRLGELCDFAVAVTPLFVDVTDWLKAFQAAVGRRVVVDLVQVSHLEVESGVTATILLRSDKDVTHALRAMTCDRRYVLDKVQLKVALDGGFVPVQLSSSGSVRLNEEDVTEIVPALRMSLPGRGLPREHDDTKG
jgi:hypothetical protein